MKSSNQEIVYLSFPTKPEVSYLLKRYAQAFGMTQPELINTLCLDFIENTISVLESRGFMTKKEVEEMLKIIGNKKE